MNRQRQDRWLLERMAAGDSHAREALAARFMPLAHKLARRYSGGRDTYDDVFQVACLGLLKAIDGFDVGRDVSEMQVSRLIRSALERLRAVAAHDQLMTCV